MATVAEHPAFQTFDFIFWILWIQITDISNHTDQPMDTIYRFYSSIHLDAILLLNWGFEFVECTITQGLLEDDA